MRKAHGRDVTTPEAGKKTEETRAADRAERSGVRDFLTFVGIFFVIVAVLGSWNAVQTLEDAHWRLWGELAFFGLIVWFSIVVLSFGLAAISDWIVDKTRSRWAWTKHLRLNPVTIPQALAWAAVVMVSVPIAVLYRLRGFALLIGLSVLVYGVWWFLNKRKVVGRRPVACYSALVGLAALCLFATFSRETDVESADPAPATAAVPGAEELADAYRPLLFFDSDERFEPVNLAEADVQACFKGLLAEDCDSVTPEGSLDGYEHLLVVEEPLAGLETPGGTDSSIYFHAVEEDGKVYLDYWWYLADNPAPVAPKVLCGPGLRWLSEACAQHPADWEGITVVLGPCGDTQPVDRCESGGGRDFAVEEVRYAQHEAVVAYSWELLQEKWSDPALASWAAHAGLHPLVFVALASHASYAAPCATNCRQIAHPAFTERRNGLKHWANNSECRSGCLQALPVDAEGNATSWNGFDGRWGAQHCILFGSYCDTRRAPRAPSFQERYRERDCARLDCVLIDRF
jgi:hypothetical protein